MTQTQALDILLQALPSAAASSLAKQLSTPQLSTFSTQTTSPTTFSTVVSQSTSSFESSTSATQSTTTSLATASATSIAAQTTGAASTAALSNPGLSPGAIAGIAFGSVAAVLLVLFVLLFFVRSRRERGLHQRSGSQTSLLSSITERAVTKKKKKIFPEIAWLYDPVRSAPQSATIHSNRNSRPQMGANAPWNSRPSTTAEYERTLTALPSGSVAEMSALPGTPGFLRTDDLTRQPSYPLRTTFPAENVAQESMSPLLPPLPRTAVREGRESLGHHAITTDENTNLRAREPAWTGAFRGNAVRPSMDGRPQTRHGMPPARGPAAGAF